MKFTGYASTTETPYDMGWYDETIARGAFKATLAQDPDVVLNIGHGRDGSGLPIARTTAGTLTLSEDDTGLKVDADLDDEDPDVQLVARKMATGALDGQMSFAFICNQDQWNSDFTRRRLTECDIHRGDVSIVTYGANPSTTSTLAARSRPDVGRPLTLEDRRRAAAIVSRAPVVVEARSFVLDGQRYEVRGAAALAARADAAGVCNRCQGATTVTLKGAEVTCPLCKGSGTGENNSATDEESDDRLAFNLGRLERLRAVR